MTILRAEIAERIFDRPLLMDEAKAHRILEVIGERLVDGGVIINANFSPVDHVAFANGRPSDLDGSMGRVSDRLGRAYDREGVAPFDVVDGVAVIPVEGTLVHKGAYVGMSSGRTSYQGLQTQIARAARSPQVRGVVFEVDSFGGEVAGAFETASMISDLSAQKPTMAILTDFALSAGYLLASQARQVVMPEHGRSGSVGVITMHADYSEAAAKKGVKVTILTAGARKADANSMEPLAPAVRERILADLEGTRQSFAKAVSRGRGRRMNTDQVLATEAGHFAGRESLKLGLADAVGDGHAAFAAFRAELNR